MHKPNQNQSSLSLPSLEQFCAVLGCSNWGAKFPVSNVTLEGERHIKGTIQDITRTRKRKCKNMQDNSTKARKLQITRKWARCMIFIMLMLKINDLFKDFEIDWVGWGAGGTVVNVFSLRPALLLCAKDWKLPISKSFYHLCSQW